MLPQLVIDKLETLPVQPGCYLFRDKEGEVVYVGKAKSLRSRVRSYFQESSGDERYFIPLLQRTVGDLETLVTSTEKEAAILENELIKQHQPRFNVKLRDDKELPLLAPRHEPHLAAARAGAAPLTRRRALLRPLPLGHRGAAHAAPGQQALSAAHVLGRRAGDRAGGRACSTKSSAARRRASTRSTRQWYADQVRAVALFLDGRHDELTGELTERMRAASRNMEFELAAVYRDQLRAVEAVREQQRVVAVKDVDQDVIGLYREGDLVEVAVLFVRAGA